MYGSPKPDRSIPLACLHASKLLMVDAERYSTWAARHASGVSCVACLWVLFGQGVVDEELALFDDHAASEQHVPSKIVAMKPLQ